MISAYMVSMANTTLPEELSEEVTALREVLRNVRDILLNSELDDGEKIETALRILDPR